MGDAAAWSPGVARRPPKKGGTGDLRVRLKEDKWNGRLSLEGLPRYDAMRDPNCPRASHNHKTSVFSNTTLLEEDFAGPRPTARAGFGWPFESHARAVASEQRALAFARSTDRRTTL